MQFPHEYFVIALSHRTNQNITINFAGVNYDEGIVHGFADFKNAETFSTEIEAKQFFEKTKFILCVSSFLGLKLAILVLFV